MIRCFLCVLECARRDAPARAATSARLESGVSRQLTQRDSAARDGMIYPPAAKRAEATIRLMYGARLPRGQSRPLATCTRFQSSDHVHQDVHALHATFTRSQPVKHELLGLS